MHLKFSPNRLYNLFNSLTYDQFVTKVLHKVFPKNNSVIKSQKLLKFDRTPFRLASVGMIFHPRQNSPHIIIEHRSSDVPRHPNEMALPGGAYDPSVDSNLFDTFARECQEEIDVPKKLLEAHSHLRFETTTTQFMVLPIVCSSKRKNLRLKPDLYEIAKISSVPIADLVLTAKVNQSVPLFPDCNEFDLPVSHGWSFKLVKGSNQRQHLIWGLTANIIAQFCSQVDKHFFH
ncbi:nucleoside diphosphate-linked moiety x motif 8 [Anaeramoeba flamelloides]|uniref:Nucleoside diphosphate-linked moiety x motif n=1 Tax=Anaeramoeba flamelloides TaxID=1746091 RepID=A0AAV7ZBR5_9EUKA|nr:nucleoside diphosphate-linked moiety x motif [Anaeramoeba flamelloides]KAJ6248804.1 nucleoside diphosphate-linked moiety x motif 8 [Anaeramoeba flamelloides]